MFAKLQEMKDRSKNVSLAKSFADFGWLGFWTQIVIGFVPVVLTAYALIFNRSVSTGTRSGFALVEILSAASLLMLAFTTVWFYRYTRLAARIADPQNRPPASITRRAAWIGVLASTSGIVFSVLVMLFEVIQLLIYFLRVPQVGIPTVQTTTGGAASWVSAADMVSLLILILTLFVEIIVLTFSLWLLFRTMTASMEYPDADA